MSIITNNGTVKKMLNANGDVLGDLTGATAFTTTPFTFQGKGSKLADYVINGASGGVGDYDESTGKYLIPITITGKNLLNNNYQSEVYNGITVTVNADKSITLNGTATDNCTICIYNGGHSLVTAAYQIIENGNYILSGAHEGQTTSTYMLSYRYDDAIGSNSSVLGRVPVDGVPIDNTSGAYRYLGVYIAVWSGATVNNVTFRPMLRKVNTSDTYEPPFNKSVTLSIDTPLGAGDTLTLNDTGVDIPIRNGLNTISINTSVQPSEVTIYTNESGERHSGKIMDNSNNTLVDLFPFKSMSKVSYYTQDGNTLLGKEYVAYSETATGNIVPNKEATAQYTYNFVGWNTSTNQTTATTDVLQNITADKNVYAAFSETVRTYTVYFYNESTLLQTVTNVPYGGTATYTETEPTKTDYVFNGWSPSPTNIIADTSCYAQFIAPYITDSWDVISQRSNAGTAPNYYAVGDCKPVYLKGTMGTLALNTTLYVYILGFDHNIATEASSYSHSITFGGFKTSYDNGVDVALVDSNYNSTNTSGLKWFNMNHYQGSSSSGHNFGGWKGCDMRYDILGSTNRSPSGYGAKATTSNVGYDATSTCATTPVTNTLMSCLPSELRAVMKPVIKYTDNNGNSSNTSANVTTSIDYLPLLSEYEVQGARSYANQYEQNNQARYAYYAAGNSKVKYRHSTTTSTAGWWVRSPSYSNAYRFCGVGTSGGAGSYGSRGSYGVAPAFVV